jgi:hypothetical protein
LGYDSGMDERAEKELKILIEKRWDPRRGVGKTLGTIRYGLLIALVVFIGIGYMVSIPWLHFLVIPVLILVWFLPRGIQARTKARLVRSDWFLCPWCRYSLVGLEDSGVCPECGAGYRKDVCVNLFQSAYRGYQPDPQVLKERESKLWHEAIELRDGVMDTEGATR